MTHKDVEVAVRHPEGDGRGGPGLDVDPGKVGEADGRRGYRGVGGADVELCDLFARNGSTRGSELSREHQFPEINDLSSS